MAWLYAWSEYSRIPALVTGEVESIEVDHATGEAIEAWARANCPNDGRSRWPTWPLLCVPRF